MISIKNVSFGYEKNKEIIHKLCLEIEKGECILLCGESGCGKSTITKMMNGLIPHFTNCGYLNGTVSVGGLSVADSKLYELSRQIGSVFQNPKSQFFYTESDGELEFALENQGAEPDYIRQRVRETTINLKIKHLRNRNVFTMSGGEKQLLAFASVYASDPQCFILDEPTANLDNDTIEKLKNQIAVLKRQGKTVIIAEHRLYFLTELIDRAIYIKNGTVDRVFSRDEFTALSEKERIRMGLRTLKQIELTIPPVKAGETPNGLTVSDLCIRYKNGPYVIKKLSFAANAGEIIGITGNNGVGKTTFIRCLCGLLKEKSGYIKINGNVLSFKKRKKACYLVMQDVNHQLFYDSVYNECEQIRDNNFEEIEKVLASFDLLQYRERHPMSLSGGQKQRLAIATAFLSMRPLLIFDEPTSGLDYVQMRGVSKMLREAAKKGHIILVVSHDRELLQEACDKLLVL